MIIGTSVVLMNDINKVDLGLSSFYEKLVTSNPNDVNYVVDDDVISLRTSYFDAKKIDLSGGKVQSLSIYFGSDTLYYGYLESITDTSYYAKIERKWNDESKWGSTTSKPRNFLELYDSYKFTLKYLNLSNNFIPLTQNIE